MSDYTQLANFTAKDQLPSGTGGAKIIRGTEWDAEFAAISTAVASKYDSTDLADLATGTAGASNTTLTTPLRVTNYMQANSFLAGLRKGRYGHVKQTTSEINIAQAISAALQGFNIAAGKTYAIRGVIAIDAASTNTNVKLTATQTPQIFQLFMKEPGVTTASVVNIQAHDTNFTLIANHKYEFMGVIRGHATLDSTLSLYHGNGIASILGPACFMEIIQLD